MIEKLKRFLWSLAVKYCNPAHAALDTPTLVFKVSETTCRITEIKVDGRSLPHLITHEKAEALPLLPLLRSALHYLNQNPELSDKTIIKDLGDRIRGKLEEARKR